MWSWIKHTWWGMLGYESCTVCHEPMECMIFTDRKLNNAGHKECLLLARERHEKAAQLVLIDNEKKEIQ